DARLSTAREPEAARAWTIATSAWATSRRTSVCDGLLSPLMGAQARPFALQRIHWYVNAFGAGFHLPLSTWTLPPTVDGPERRGWTSEASGGEVPATGPITLA